MMIVTRVVSGEWCGCGVWVWLSVGDGEEKSKRRRRKKKAERQRRNIKKEFKNFFHCENLIVTKRAKYPPLHLQR
jgi:hypothetical protein